MVEFRLDVRVSNIIYTGKEQDESTVYMMSPGSNPASETSYILILHAAEFAGKVVVYTNFKYS